MAARKGAVANAAEKVPGNNTGPVQEAILEAALEAFAQRGYDGVSVRELNRQVGVSHNLVHHYFGSKEALWRAAIDHGLNRVNEAWNPEHLKSVKDPVERMKLGLRRFLEVTARSPAVQRILEHEAAVGGPRLDYIAERYVIPFLSPRLDRYEEATAIHKRDLNLASIALLTASGATAFFTQAALARKIGGPDPFSEEGIERHIHTMTTILFYGVLGRPPEADDNQGEDT
jgi:AcrR family transcriptional regulator